MLAIFLCGCQPDLGERTSIYSESFDRIALDQSQSVSVIQPAGRAILITAEGYETEFEVLSYKESGELIGHARISYLRTVPVHQFIEASGEERKLTVKIQPINQTKNSGIELSIFVLSDRSEDDRQLAEAFRLYSEAIQHVESEDPELWSEKVVKLNLAAGKFERLGMNEAGLWSRFLSAYFEYFPIYNFGSAIEQARNIQEEASNQGASVVLLMALQLEGQALSERDESDDMNHANRKLNIAQSQLSKAILLANELGMEFEKAWATNYRGIGHYYAGNLEKAVEFYTAAGELSSALEAKRLSLSVFGNIALISEQLGQYDKAIEALEQILDELPARGRQHERAHFLAELGRIYHKLHLFDYSVPTLVEAKEIADDIGSTIIAGKADATLAWAYFNMGQRERAKEIALLAISELDGSNNARQLHDMYELLSETYRYSRSFDELNQNRQFQNQYMLSGIDQAKFQLELARDQIAAGNERAALQMLSKILDDELENMPVQLRMLILFEFCYLDQGADENGICSLDSLEIQFLDWADRFLLTDKFQVQHLLSKICIKKGETVKAKLYLSSLIDEIALYRRTLPGVLGAWYWNERISVFETYLELLVGGSASNEEAWTSIYALDELVNIEGIHSAVGEENAGKEVTKTERTLRSLLIQRSASNERNEVLKYSVLIDRYLLGLAQAQSAGQKVKTSREFVATSHLFKKSALLTYYISSTNAWLWYLDASGISLHRLGNSSAIVQNIRSARNSLDWEQIQQQILALNTLSVDLLGAVQKRLPETLKIYATGELTGFPMDTLRLDGHFLAENHDVINVLSLKAALDEKSEEPLTLAEMSIALYGPQRDSNSELAGAKREIELIRDLAKKEFSEVTLGSAQTSGSRDPSSIFDSDIVHIAGHGVLNRGYPELSYLAFDSSVAAGDMTLLPIELAPKSCENVGLVFLSSCQSSGSSEFGFEPALGFTSLLLDSGAGHVIASLWPVSDRKTTEFVIYFYSALLHHRNYRKALAHSKRYYISHKGSEYIREWAAFQLYTR